MPGANGLAQSSASRLTRFRQWSPDDETVGISRRKPPGQDGWWKAGRPMPRLASASSNAPHSMTHWTAVVS